MSRSRVALLVLVALTAGNAALAAQTENKHQRNGFWVGLGLGAGFLGDEDFSNWEVGLSGRFMIGGSFGPNIKVGYEGNSWVRSVYGNMNVVSMGGLTVHLYPSTTGGFHVIVGGGASVWAIENNDSETGGAAFAGLGYDLRIGGNISLTPYSTFNAGFFGGGQLYLITAGASITFH